MQPANHALLSSHAIENRAASSDFVIKIALFRDSLGQGVCNNQVCTTGADLAPQSSITPLPRLINCYASIVCLFRLGVSCAQGASKGKKQMSGGGAPGYD